MKITLDLEKLQAAGALSAEDAERLAALAEPRSGLQIVANVLLIIGALAVAAGVIALEPSPGTGLTLALAALGGGAAIYFRGGESWRVLAHGLVIMGAVGVSGWAAWQGAETWPEGAQWLVHPISLAMFVGGATLFRQAFLAALAPLALGAWVGSGTAYGFASYTLFVREATISVLVFTALALTLYWARRRLGESRRLLLTVAARVSVFMIHLAFWVGSLWGDYVGELWAAGDDWAAAREWRDQAVHVPEVVFSLGWLVVCAAGIWFGTRDGRRFLANTSIVFLSIHAYTQFFETLGANALTLLVGGAGMVAAAAGIARFDAWVRARAAA
ncbi:MAG: hypothetical protein AAFR11_09835 [Pseudomonadota bacterium]